MKTDAGLNKDDDIVVCLLGARIKHVIGYSKPWDIAMEDISVHIGTSNADEEGTTGIIEEDAIVNGWVDGVIRSFVSVWRQQPRVQEMKEGGNQLSQQLYKEQNVGFVQNKFTGLL